MNSYQVRLDDSTIISLGTIIGKKYNLDSLLLFLQTTVKEDILGVEEVTTGLVHYVYKITTPTQKYYWKLRGNRFSRIPVDTDPSLIHREYWGLQYFYGLAPSVFPKVLDFDTNYNSILMTDVQLSRHSLEEVYNNRLFDTSEMVVIAHTLGKIHKKSLINPPKKIPKNISDRAKDLLKYNIKVKEDYELLQEIEDVYLSRAQYMCIGDLSPKNILVSKKDLGICDLDSVHLGCFEYDLAYVIGHCVIHMAVSPAEMENIVNLLITNYTNHVSYNLLDQHLLIKMIIAVLYYRLFDDFVPYNVNLSVAEKNFLKANVHKILIGNECPDNLQHLLKQILCF